jgi:hypothetical protein
MIAAALISIAAAGQRLFLTSLALPCNMHLRDG